MIRYDHTLVDLISHFFVLCTNVKFICIIIHSGWSLALIFMNERVNQSKHKTGYYKTRIKFLKSEEATKLENNNNGNKTSMEKLPTLDFFTQAHKMQVL